MIIHDLSMIAMRDELEDAWNETCSNYSSNISYKLNEVTTAKNGTCYSIVLDDGNGKKVQVITKKRPSDGALLFDCTLCFGNMDGTFYTSEGADSAAPYDNPENLMLELLEELATHVSGTFIAEGGYNDVSVAVIDGNPSAALRCMYVEDTGKIYARNAVAKSGTVSMPNSSTSIDKTLNEFIKENADLEAELKALSTTQERVDFIGKWLISKKIDDDITYELFKEQFMQAGLLGYKDKTCNMMYQILS